MELEENGTKVYRQSIRCIGNLFVDYLLSKALHLWGFFISRQTILSLHI